MLHWRSPTRIEIKTSVLEWLDRQKNISHRDKHNDHLSCSIPSNTKHLICPLFTYTRSTFFKNMDAIPRKHRQKKAGSVHPLYHHISSTFIFHSFNRCNIRKWMIIFCILLVISVVLVVILVSSLDTYIENQAVLSLCPFFLDQVHPSHAIIWSPFLCWQRFRHRESLSIPNNRYILLSHLFSPLLFVSSLQPPAYLIVPIVDNVSEPTSVSVPSDTLDLLVLQVRFFSCLFISSSLSSRRTVATSSCSAGSVTAFTPLFSITFGFGSPDYSALTPADFGFTTTYTQVTADSPQEGKFGILRSVPRNKTIWHNGELDYTPGDTKGYMLMVNADYPGKEFYQANINGLIEGSQYYWSCYLANIVKTGNNLLRPDVTFQVRAATGNALLKQTRTGPIIETATLTWQQYGMTFVASSTSVVLLMISNVGGGGGNDIVVDQIELRGCTPTSSSQYAT